MNTIRSYPLIIRAKTVKVLVVAAAAAFIIAGCATVPQSPAGAAEVRNKLEALKSDAVLAKRVPVEIREAEAAVLVAEAPVGKDVPLGEHRVYMATHLVDVAIATAETREAEDRREMLGEKRNQMRLDARTREADRARRDAATARDASDSAQAEAADKARELQRQIDVLQAEATERGLVLTLGDVLFSSGQSYLVSGGEKTLDKLVAFLNQYPEREVSIEGHTDDVGSFEMNQALSQRRAESVKDYLLQQGIQAVRLDARGLGETQPIAQNSSDAGRQQNRRVEVVIKNPPPVVPTASTPGDTQ